jgi:hypothetical protein
MELIETLTLQKHFFGTPAVANDLCSTRKRYLGHPVKSCQVTIVLMKPVENFKFLVFFENSLLCTLDPRPKVHHTCFSCFTGVSPPILIDALVMCSRTLEIQRTKTFLPCSVDEICIANKQNSLSISSNTVMVT